MREVNRRQLHLGQTDIASITFDARSRDDVPQILQGLQYIYLHDELREAVFEILEGVIPEDVDPHQGRPGMELWNVLVLATLRVNLNWDYDRLQEMANQHRTIRQMLGHGSFDEQDYKLQTLKDNVGLLDEEALQRINKVVVDAGHSLLKKKEENLSARCDSFVLETNIHYPTDINLLFDAMRCSLRTIARLCQAHQISDWRQWRYNTRQVKKHYRKAQKLKHSTSKDPLKQAQKKQDIQQAHEAYINLSTQLLNKMKQTLEKLPSSTLEPEHANLSRWMAHGRHQVNLIRRRVIEGEKIPHHEKIFSIFEEYSEWISKGKAGVPVELGLKVCILESSMGFILHHQVMQHCSDSDIAIDIIKRGQFLYPALSCCSFDKGFHSPRNQQELAGLLDEVVLPKKGRWSKADRARETTESFKKARRAHSAVESGINALEVHGLDRCLDRGLERFKQYVSLAVVGRNLQKIGAHLQAEALKKLQKQEAARKRRLAA